MQFFFSFVLAPLFFRWNAKEIGKTMFDETFARTIEQQLEIVPQENMLFKSYIIVVCWTFEI